MIAEDLSGGENGSAEQGVKALEGVTRGNAATAAQAVSDSAPSAHTDLFGVSDSPAATKPENPQQAKNTATLALLIMNGELDEWARHFIRSISGTSNLSPKQQRALDELRLKYLEPKH